MDFFSNLKNKLTNYKDKPKASKFSGVEKELFSGNYTKALNLLDELENNVNNTTSDLINCLIYKSFAFIYSANPTKGLELADQILSKYNEPAYQFFIGKAYIAKAYALHDTNKIPEGIECLEKGNSILTASGELEKEENRELNAQIYYIKGRLARKKNEIPNSLEALNKALEYSTGSHNQDGLGDIYAEIGLLYFMTGNPEKSISSLLEAIKIFRNLNSKIKLLKVYNNIGRIYQSFQNPDKALEYYLLATKLLEELGDQFKSQLGILTLNIGLLNLDKGEIDIALSYIERAEKISNEIGANDQKAYALQAIAVIYELKGDVTLALETYEKVLKIFEELNIDKEIGSSHNNIGNAYVTKGELNQAISHFEQSLEYYKKSGDRMQVASLFNLIDAYAAMGNLEKATSYLDELEKLNKGEDRLADQFYKLAKAATLKKSKRIIKRAEAQLIYQQIAYDELIDHQNTVASLFNLCEMLIQELRTSGNESIISEVKDVISELIKIAQNQNSYKILVQSKLLESKVALLELDLDTAKESLSEAQKIAFEKGLDNLAMVISGEYDSLIDQLSKWKDLIDSNVSMIERLEMAELEGLVSNMVRKKADSPEMLSEIPELFLVLNDQGMKIYSKVFTSESNLDDQVVGDLLTAVNAFIQETFSASGSIERLKHKEHTLMLKPIDKYLTCYVFKGQSYTALQKLEKFIESIKKEEQMYQNVLSSTDEIKDENFSSLVQTIFTAKETAS